MVASAAKIFGTMNAQQKKDQQKQNDLLKQIAEKLNIPDNKISGGK
ncbi:hypothetical protein [Ferrovum sp.]|nr:hypothetical protein [Ferrovum sp.]